VWRRHDDAGDYRNHRRRRFHWRPCRSPSRRACRVASYHCCPCSARSCDLHHELPSRLNFRIALSLSALPPTTQTLLVDLDARARVRPFIAFAGPAPGTQQIASASNSSTGGAETQHFERGGFSVRPLFVVGQRTRAMDDQCGPWKSTVMPPTWPRIQLFGQRFRPGRVHRKGRNVAGLRKRRHPEKSGGGDTG